MFFFKSKYEHELDEIIREIDMNMSNNYKDAAQQNLVRLEMRFNEMVKDGLLKVKAKAAYETKLNGYKSRMKGYTHRDQNTLWN